jgi:acyl-coenzyme A thioesterase 13
MAAEKTKKSMPGVAEGIQLVATPMDEDLSPEDKVNGMLQNSMSEDVYQVSVGFGYVTLLPGEYFENS